MAISIIEKGSLTKGGKITGVGRYTADETASIAIALGDSNPIHSNPKEATKLGFPDVVVSNNAVEGIVSGMVSSLFPNCMARKKQVSYRSPLCADDKALVALEISMLRLPVVEFAVNVINERTGEVVITGSFSVSLASE